MAINKFVDRKGNTLLDLSVDSVTSENFVLAGKTYHGPDGLQHTGTLNPGPLDYSQYNFIDYDGTLLYSYTDEQLDALTALPAGPDHTADNLTFQEWNWSLENLKAWDRTRPDRPLVGANYITTDGKTYMYIDTPITNGTLSFSVTGTVNSIDWGDGTVNTTTEHTYANPGKYVVCLDLAEGAYFNFYRPLVNIIPAFITDIRLGNLEKLNDSSLNNATILKTITIRSGVLSNTSFVGFKNCYNLKSIVIPNGTTNIGDSCFYYNYKLKTVSLPNNITELSHDSFRQCYSLKGLVFPETLNKIGSTAFNGIHTLNTMYLPKSLKIINDGSFGYTNLSYINIPDSVTSIEQGAFNECQGIILDLSQQTKVIALSSSILTNGATCKILVPSSLLEQYKSASYWSNHASYMVGV